MKFFLITAALLSVALATPIATPTSAPEELTQEVGYCQCEPVFCITEIIGECKCKNAAAEKCYQSWLEQGVQCPKPTPKPCGEIIIDPIETPEAAVAASN